MFTSKALSSLKRRPLLLLFGLASFSLILLISYSFLLRGNSPDEVTLQPIILLNEEAQPKNIHFIFLNGLGCFYDNNVYSSMGFERIRESLAGLGYSFCDDRFLLYSYTGGKTRNGLWQPEKYTEKDTGQPLNISVEKLEELFEQFSLANPEAKFILIGHSLGGRIALDFISSTSPMNRAKVKAVVTLDSPLLGAGRGVPNLIINLLRKKDSIFASPAVRELISEYRQQQELASLRLQTIKALQKNGVRIATFSSKQDFVVKPLTACLQDEHKQAISEGSIINLGILSVLDFYGHIAILDSPYISQYIISLFTE